MGGFCRQGARHPGLSGQGARHPGLSGQDAVKLAQGLNGDDDLVLKVKVIDDPAGVVATLGAVHALGIDEEVRVEGDPQS